MVVNDENILKVADSCIFLFDKRNMQTDGGDHETKIQALYIYFSYEILKCADKKKKVRKRDTHFNFSQGQWKVQKSMKVQNRHIKKLLVKVLSTVQTVYMSSRRQAGSPPVFHSRWLEECSIFLSILGLYQTL